MSTRIKATISVVLLFLVLLAFIAVAPVLAWTGGCTPGYWKNHLDAWGLTPFVPDGLNATEVGHVFTATIQTHSVFSLTLASEPLLEALNYRGGRGVQGAGRILLRAAVASLLNANHPDVDWDPLEPAPGLVELVNGALEGERRSGMLWLAGFLDSFNNNVSCPF